MLLSGVVIGPNIAGGLEPPLQSPLLTLLWAYQRLPCRFFILNSPQGAYSPRSPRNKHLMQSHIASAPQLDLELEFF